MMIHLVNFYDNLPVKSLITGGVFMFLSTKLFKIVSGLWDELVIYGTKKEANSKLKRSETRNVDWFYLFVIN